ncbi:MAG TPA: IPT/TIG domain-containing protein [Solirubrobacteraceae bacterium]|nr:IPT/TIG domain-containing protein [Solirubrobacteraceae bacterium]
MARSIGIRAHVGPRLAAAVIAATLGLAAPAAAKGPATTCEGPFTGEAQSIVVPGGATCTLEATAKVTGDVKVEPGGSLADRGASIGGSINANKPAGVEIGGLQHSVVGQDVHIDGLTGSILGADNALCNASIGHDLHIEHAAATAAPIVVGDPPDCSAGVEVVHDVHVEGNATHVDVSETSAGHDIHVQKNTAGVVVENTTSGHDLHVQDNSGGVVVSNNHADHNAKCSGNKPETAGEGNTQNKGRPKGCPAPPPPPSVKHVTPDKGPTAGGTAVVITGSAFTGTEKVAFGATEVPFTVVSDTEITTTAPAAAAEGTVDVTVTTPQGTSTKKGHFEYKNH